jgi:lysophospholipase L1-like esterase
MGAGITKVAVKKVLKSELGMVKAHIWVVLLVASVAAVAGCEKKDGTPTGPSPVPAPNSAITYSALGASDVMGVGSTSPCIFWDDCATGKGYVQVSGRELRSRGFTVDVRPLGLPGAVLSRRILNLAAQYGRSDILVTILDQEAPFILTATTVVSIFTGVNDINALTHALGGGAGSADRVAFVNAQIGEFGQDFNALMQVVRGRAPAARIVVLNLPNVAGMPYLANATRDHRLAAQMLSVGMTSTVFNPLVSSGVLVVDLMCDARSYETSTYSADGMHPSDAGYAWISAEVVAATTTSYKQPQFGCSHTTKVS